MMTPAIFSGDRAGVVCVGFARSLPTAPAWGHSTSRRGLMAMSRFDADLLPQDERRDPVARGDAAASGEAPNESAPASREAKIFRDAEGATWWVHEVAGEHLGVSGVMCLLVVSANELRRIWKYPAVWRQLSPAELLALPQSATTRLASNR
jgi:hypothetical protein